MKFNKISIVLLLLVAMLLSMTLVACTKSDVTEPETPIDPAPVEYATAQDIYLSLYGLLEIDGECRFDRGYPDADGLNADESVLYDAILQDFAAEVASKNFLKSKKDSLVNIVSFIGSMDSQKVMELIDVCKNSDLTAEDTSIIVTAIYNAMISNLGNTDIFFTINAKANEYINAVNAKYSSAEYAEELNYVKNNAAYTYLNNFVKWNRFEFIKDGELTETQYNHLRPIFNGLSADILPEYATAVAAVEADAEIDSLLNYTLAKYDSIAMPVAPEVFFVDEMEKFNAVNTAVSQFKNGNWVDVFQESNYTVASEEAYDYINEFYNGIPADAEKGIEAVKGYKEICPTTKAVIPADYTGLNYDWFNTFLRELEANVIAASKAGRIDVWYKGAYGTVKYMEICDVKPAFVISEQLNNAILDVLQPMVETVYNFGGIVETVMSIFEGESSVVNNSDILSFIDALNISLDEINSFIVDNSAKLTTLTNELRNNAYNSEDKGEFAETSLFAADALDSIVGAGPEIIKLLKLFTTAIDEDIINSFEFSHQFFVTNRNNKSGPVLSSYPTIITVAKVFSKVFANDSFNSAEELQASLDTIINGVKGMAFASVSNLIDEEYDLAADYACLLEIYYASYACDVADQTDCLEWYASIAEAVAEGDLSTSTASYLTVPAYEYDTVNDMNVVTKESFAACRAEILEVIELIRPVANKYVSQTIADTFVKPLYENSVTYNTFDEEGMVTGQETKTCLELIDALANATPPTNLFINDSEAYTKEISYILDMISYLSSDDAMGSAALGDAIQMVAFYANMMLGNTMSSEESKELYVEAKFEGNATESKKIFVQPTDTIFISFTYKTICDEVLLKVSSNVEMSEPSSIDLYVVDAYGNINDNSYISLNYDASRNVFYINGADLVPGFRYAIELDREFYDSVMVTLNYQNNAE